jgi:hypothetical protein
VRSSRSRRSACAGLLLVAAASTVSAHRRDEFLQAARLDIGPDRVELQLDLTPGIAIADRVVAQIDRDRNGVISEAEARAYAAVVERQTLLEFDGRRLVRQLVEDRTADEDAMRRGEGTLRLRWTAPLPPMADGAHRLRFVNAHDPDLGVYLANVLVPSSDRVAVTAQDRDVDQRSFTVDYERRGGRHRRAAFGVLAAGLGGVVAGLAARHGRRPARAPSLRTRARLSRT